MIRSIIVTDLYQLLDKIESDDIQQNAWVTILDPEFNTEINTIDKYFNNRDLVHLVQTYYDWSDEMYLPKDVNPNKLPQKYNIVELVSFLQKIVDSEIEYDLGINCYAGMCRSTAAGVIAWYLQNSNSKKALDDIIKVRSVAWPNQRMLNFAQELLGGDISDTVKGWKQSVEGTLFTGE